MQRLKQEFTRHNSQGKNASKQHKRFFFQEAPVKHEDRLPVSARTWYGRNSTIHARGNKHARMVRILLDRHLKVAARNSG